MAAQGGRTVVLAEVSYGESQLCIVFPVVIGKEAMALVKAAAPWKIPSGIAGKIEDVPFNIESCLECVTRCVLSTLSFSPGTRFAPVSLIFAPGINRIMNLRIREDVTNAMSLRTEMRRRISSSSTMYNSLHINLGLRARFSLSRSWRGSKSSNRSLICSGNSRYGGGSGIDAPCGDLALMTRSANLVAFVPEFNVGGCRKTKYRPHEYFLGP
jgi:hypothetical protein